MPTSISQGRRIVVFVVGGITRSEMRVAHLMSRKLGRDIVLGGTSLDEPEIFLTNLLVSNFELQNWGSRIRCKSFS